MERSPLLLRIGESIITENGARIRAVHAPRRRLSLSSKTKHEVAHIEAAQRDGGIHKATIIGTSEYDGATWPVVLTAFSAMAAKGERHDGTGWDEFLTRYILQKDPVEAASSAASYLSGRRDYMQAVGEVLEEKETIGQEDVDKAHEKVDAEKAGIHKVKLEIVQPDGKKNVRDVTSENNTVMVRGEWYSVRKRKQDSSESVVLAEGRSRVRLAEQRAA